MILDNKHILNKNVNTHCKFCGEHKKLCNAHLWPGGLSKIFMHQSDNFIQLSTKTGNDRPIQTLEFDKHILCKECDGKKLGYLDNHLICLIRDYFMSPDRLKPYNSEEPLRVLEFPLDSEKFKLGLLTSLLRMSFSEKAPQVSLGTTYEKMLIKWIKARSIPTSESKRFDIIMIGYAKHPKDYDRTMILQPDSSSFNFSHYYVMHILGLTIIIKVGQGNWPLAMHKYPRITSKINSLQIPLCDPKEALYIEPFINILKNTKAFN